MVRCRWADPNSEIYLAYHDREWGRPEHDDRKLFEMLTLEGFQAGLSWLTILKKREAFHTAFDSFDPAVVAGYGRRRDCPQPGQDPGRHPKRRGVPCHPEGVWLL